MKRTRRKRKWRRGGGRRRRRTLQSIHRSTFARRRGSESHRTFDLPKLVDGLEAGGVVELVGAERGAEERAVGDDLARQLVLGAAQSRHLAVDQRNVEVGKLDVVALCVGLTAAAVDTQHQRMCSWLSKNNSSNSVLRLLPRLSTGRYPQPQLWCL